MEVLWQTRSAFHSASRHVVIFNDCFEPTIEPLHVITRKCDLTQSAYWKINTSLLLEWDSSTITKTQFLLYNQRRLYLVWTRKNPSRKALVRFRISSHQLRIETGRYEKIPRNERICYFCTSNKIEDENHFLLDIRLILRSEAYFSLN